MNDCKLTYSIGDIAGLLDNEPEEVRDALVAAGVRMMLGGADADLSRWPARRVQQQPDGSIVLLDIALVPSPDEVVVLADSLPQSWQSRLRAARMAQMLSDQATPEYQRHSADVEAAVKRVDDTKATLDMMREALVNAPKTGDVGKIREAQAAMNEAQKNLEQAQATLERLRGNEPLIGEAAFQDGFDSVNLGRELEADHWATLPVVQATQAAILMSGINPAQYPNPDQQAPAHADLPRYRMTLSTFESHEQHDGIKRSLRDWVSVAQSHTLQIDVRVLAAVAFAPAPSDSMSRHELAGEGSKTSAATESQAARRSRRYQMCVEAGLDMPDNDYAALPRGVGEIAKREGVSKQAFSEDIKKHIASLREK